MGTTQSITRSVQQSANAVSTAGSDRGSPAGGTLQSLIKPAIEVGGLVADYSNQRRRIKAEEAAARREQERLQREAELARKQRERELELAREKQRQTVKLERERMAAEQARLERQAELIRAEQEAARRSQRENQRQGYRETRQDARLQADRLDRDLERATERRADEKQQAIQSIQADYAARGLGGSVSEQKAIESATARFEADQQYDEAGFADRHKANRQDVRRVRQRNLLARTQMRRQQRLDRIGMLR